MCENSENEWKIHFLWCMMRWVLTWEDPKNNEVHQSHFHFKMWSFPLWLFPFMISWYTSGTMLQNMKGNKEVILLFTKVYLLLLIINRFIWYAVDKSQAIWLIRTLNSKFNLKFKFCVLFKVPDFNPHKMNELSSIKLLKVVGTQVRFKTMSSWAHSYKRDTSKNNICKYSLTVCRVTRTLRCCCLLK